MISIETGKVLSTYIDILYSNDIKMSTDGIWLCGGACRRAVVGHNIEDGDFDIYVSPDKWEEIKNKIQISPSPYFKHSFKTYNAKVGNLKIQFHVLSNKMSLESLLKTFDFTCCQFGYDGEKLYTFESSFCDTQKMLLRYTGFKSENPLNTIHRSFRFMEMGFRPSSKFYLDMQNVVSDINVSSCVKVSSDGKS